MPNGQNFPSIAILREATGKLALFIDGQRVNVRRNQTLLALLACLFDDLGRAIPYKPLYLAIGRKSEDWSTRHILRQYIRWLRGTLVTHKAPYVIAVVPEVGYALCEIAENARGASTPRKVTGDLPELGRNVRRLRTAAGLTQTALGKRFGTDRSYLSDLEKGQRNPTALTLARLARCLGVSPAAFWSA